MTCIAGIVEGNRIYMGGDSAASDPESTDLSLRADQKVFRVEEFLIGFAGSFRAGQLLKYSFVPPKRKRQDVHRYLVTTFVDAMRECFKKGGVASKEHEVEEVNSGLLIGYRGRLFSIYADYGVGEAVDGFASVGSGGQVANGALYATEGMDSRKRVRLALEAAERHDAGVRRPFYIQVLESVKKTTDKQGDRTV